MSWKNLTYAEKGAFWGFILGLALLGLSYFFKIFNKSFCFYKITEEPVVCMRYVSLLPLIFAVLGLIVGLIIRKVKK